MALPIHAQPPGADFDPSELRPPVADPGPDTEGQVAIELGDQEAYVPEDSPDAMGFDQLVIYLTVFALAIFVGFEIITKIPPTLHTPLMSGSNAISGITIVGAVLVGQELVHPGAGSPGQELVGAASNQLLRNVMIGVGFLAVVFATINVVGGFLVTNRMLSMFRKRN